MMVLNCSRNESPLPCVSAPGTEALMSRSLGQRAVPLSGCHTHKSALLPPRFSWVLAQYLAKQRGCNVSDMEAAFRPNARGSSYKKTVRPGVACAVLVQNRPSKQTTFGKFALRRPCAVTCDFASLTVVVL